MKGTGVSSINVQVWASHHHHWHAGQTLHHNPARHGGPALQYHLWLVQEGAVEVEAQERKWRIESGEAILLPIGLERDIRTPAPARWLSVLLWITVFHKFSLLEHLPLPVQWRPDATERPRLESWMEQIVRERAFAGAHHHLIVGGLASALLGLCWPHLSALPLEAALHSELPQWLARTLRHIGDDLTCNIADLAHEAGFSPAQFRRAFYQWIGETPRDYLKTRRLEAARHLLEHTDLPLRAVVAHSGWNDVTHFSRLFRSVYGLSPSHYRASLRYERK